MVMRAMRVRVAVLAGLALVAAIITSGSATVLAKQVFFSDGGTPSLAGLTGTRTSKTLKTAIVPNGSWTTYHRNNARTGNDPTLPTVSTVTTGWTSATMDAEVYASPLVYGGIVYAATLNNTVYAFNQSDGSPVWSAPTHLRTPESSGWGCGNVTPQGILGTPVIDPTTGIAGRIYVATLDGTDDLYRVEGLNLLTGAEELNTTIPASIGTGFDWRIQQQRGALSVANGYVYVPFGGRAGDCGNYSGWVVGVPTSGTGPIHVYQTPGIGNGIWNAGGIAIDDTTGKIFATTGNGDINNGCSPLVSGSPQYENDAVARLSATLVHEDFFIPPDWELNWCKNDQDLGSTTALLISPTLLFQSGKWGTGFLLNPTNLGGVGGQLYPTPKPATYLEANVCFGNNSDATFGSYAYAAPFIYVECESHGLVALRINTSTPSFSPCDTCAAPDWNAGGTTTFGPPIVAAGAVWVASNSGLWAYRADTGAQIYHSATFGMNRFVTPAEAGGQVFVPSHLVIRSFNMIFGASQSSPAPIPPGRPTPAMQTPAPAPGSRSPVGQSSPQPPPTGR